MASDIKKEIFQRFTQAAIKKGKELSPYIIVNMLYKKIFDHRTISDPIKRFEIDDFPFLKSKRHVFYSNGNLLTGYFYYYDKCDKSRVVIFAHGYGNGHHRYLDLINYLAKAGLYVFSYDCTSFDESSGEGIDGFPQGVVDLANTIKYINKLGYKEKDISLVGHSWGAYSVGAVTNEFKNINKVIAIAGFNYAVDLIHEQGYQWVGDKINEQIPIMKEREISKFGRYGDYKVIDAIKNSNSKYFFIHSQDDDVVPINIGLYLYQKEYKESERIKYKIYDNRGHVCYYTIEGNNYFDELKSNYQKYQKGKELSFDDKKHLLNLLIDKDKFLNMLDYNLIDEIIDFIKK